MSELREHELRCWPEYYREIIAGRKTFEIRKNDRDFRIGDILMLLEWSPVSETYSNRRHLVEVTYITDFAQQPGYVVMGIAPVTASAQAGTEAKALLAWKERWCRLLPWEALAQLEALIAAAPKDDEPPMPTNEELERVAELHQGHPADFAADVLERWGGWQKGLLGYGGSLNVAPKAESAQLAAPVEAERSELERHLTGEHHAITAQNLDSPFNRCMFKETCLHLRSLAMGPAPATLAPDSALAEELFSLLNQKYVQKADERQRSLGLQYMTAETHDLAKTVANFIAALRGGRK